ncbi:GNAT family N-acetyltransferase [Microlunatus speluncae]|uniref:GNAT family N-acetyltransferase n=1 Tax=Microlunatus speluncae TaxID=2594267 RepID=UPI00126661D8|nr:GNAT family N-acetyltransferase [Microlunatus speluncae]
MIEIRGAASAAEVEAAMVVLDSVLGNVRGWQLSRAQQRELYLATPTLLSIAVDDGRIVGAAGCDGASGIGGVAVLDECRGQGLGRQLLERAEAILRERGADTAGLGSLDGAVAFYLRCGYEAKLLVQFAPEVDDPEPVIADLLAGVLAGRIVDRRDWQGHPQLWLRESSVDWELKRRIEDVAGGVVAQYVMDKRL